MEKIKVFVADNSALFRQGVRATLSLAEDIEVVGESGVKEEALALIEAFAPDVLLVDVGLPFLTGFTLARRISHLLPGLSVVMLSPRRDDEEIFEALKAGAVAYLTKEISGEELSDTIRKVFQGERLINETLLARPRVAERVLTQFQSLSMAEKELETLAAPITSREAEVLSYVAQGYGNKQIAHTLSISEQTIKNHITSILRKLNANDRTHAVVLALRSGWIKV